tara:strand:+ start:1531 stop:1752 length:222 start_codon:yes stop_codon:yes gene_type:complete
MTEKINLDGKDYSMDEMSDAQKYLISLVQEQQLKISEARKDIDIATAANKTLIEELKKSLAEEKSETKKIAEG